MQSPHEVSLILYRQKKADEEISEFYTSINMRYCVAVCVMI